MTSRLPSSEELRKIYEADPEALEILREEIIEEYISSTPKEQQDRLRGLQFTINGIRKTSKNSLHSLLRISKMMLDSFQELRSSLISTATLSRGEEINSLEETSVILNFEKKEENDSENV